MRFKKEIVQSSRDYLPTQTYRLMLKGCGMCCSRYVYVITPCIIDFRPSKREETECVIRSALKGIMMSVDLDEVTSKFIRGRLEETLDMDLGEYKPFIDQEMLTVLGQMDAATQIFPHVYLGSEWNASNLDELNLNGYVM